MDGMLEDMSAVQFREWAAYLSIDPTKEQLQSVEDFEKGAMRTYGNNR